MLYFHSENINKTLLRNLTLSAFDLKHIKLNSFISTAAIWDRMLNKYFREIYANKP